MNCPDCGKPYLKPNRNCGGMHPRPMAGFAKARAKAQKAENAKVDAAVRANNAAVDAEIKARGELLRALEKYPIDFERAAELAAQYAKAAAVRGAL